MLDEQAIRAILRRGEGSRLDYKRDQYPIEGTDAERAELLKDIIAFANAWGADDAYILIGVEEQEDGTGVACGVSSHFEDANLQQFVTSQLNRPLTFSYYQRTVDGASVGVITIPRQERPFYLKKAFGGLPANAAFIRRGSSTAIATPDDLVLMGRDLANSAKPHLTAGLVARETDEIVGDETIVRPHLWTWEEVRIPKQAGLALRDPNFFRKVQTFITNRDAYCAVCFAVTNLSGTLAEDIRLTLLPTGTESPVVVRRWPFEPPREHLLPTSALNLQLPDPNPDVDVVKTAAATRVVLHFGKIQPHTRSENRCFLLMASEDVVFEAMLTGDNIAPISKRFVVRRESTTSAMSDSAFWQEVERIRER